MKQRAACSSLAGFIFCCLVIGCKGVQNDGVNEDNLAGQLNERVGGGAWLVRKMAAMPERDLRDHLCGILSQEKYYVVDEGFKKEMFKLHDTFREALRGCLNNRNSFVELAAVNLLCRAGDGGDREFIMRHIDRSFGGSSGGRKDLALAALAAGMTWPNSDLEREFLEGCIQGNRGRKAFGQALLALALNGSLDAQKTLYKGLEQAKEKENHTAVKGLVAALDVCERFGEAQFASRLDQSVDILGRIRRLTRTGFRVADITYNEAGDKALVQLYGTSAEARRHSARYYATFSLSNGAWRLVYFTNYAAS